MTSTIDMFKFEKDVVTFPAGTKIFGQGDEGDIMYVIQLGQVEINVEGESIDKLGPGGIFGEMALVDDSPRSAAATAVSDVTLVPIDQDAFLRHVHSTPFFSLQVMRVVVDRLRRTMTVAGG